ncbi:MAG: DUF4293 domain-containing protein [Gemmatimonadaceae bacterium]|nr:DUF4293 domain-containing protein [Chitinophagaceae bacterium]
MIQRIQSVWLLLASTAAFLTVWEKITFYSGVPTVPEPGVKLGQVYAGTNVFLLILTVILGLVSFISIFLYKNRKQQMQFTWLALIISIINIFLYYRETVKFSEGTYDLTAIVTLIIPILLLMAIKGIYKDQKLVKSLDRLR